MSLEYPDWLDARKAAEGNREFSGTIPLARMKRLSPLLASTEGLADFEAGFAFDEQGHVAISIKVSTVLELICQRSLEPYGETIQRSSLLGVIENVDEEADLPEHYDPVLADNGRLALADLVEEELLLGMPQVPRSPATKGASQTKTEAGSALKKQGEPTQQPFAGLADLMKSRN